jgi:hypothetical protein
LNNSVVPPEPTGEEQYELLATLYHQLEVQFGNVKAGILMRRFASRFVVARKGVKRLRELIHKSSSRSDLLDLLREFLLRGDMRSDRADA